MMGYYDGYGGYGMGFFGIFWMAIFWGAVIWFIIWLVKHSGANFNNSGIDKTPMHILKERYAKGEIKKKEFDEIRKDLER